MQNFVVVSLAVCEHEGDHKNFQDAVVLLHSDGGVVT